MDDRQSHRSTSREIAPSSWGPLAAALRRLDRRLARAIAVTEQATGAALGEDPSRGLHLEQKDVEGLLGLPPGESHLWGNLSPEPAGTFEPLGRWRRLAELFGLDPFDLDLLIIALAPEVDLRYERIYGFLHDNLALRRPSVELALNLLRKCAEDKIIARARLMPESPLLRSGVIELHSDRPDDAPLLALSLRPDRAVVTFLLGGSAVETIREGRGGGSIRLLAKENGGAPLITRPSLDKILHQLAATERERCPVLYFSGRAGRGQEIAAARIADAFRSDAYAVSLTSLSQHASGFSNALRSLLRAARLDGAVLLLEDVDGVLETVEARMLAEIGGLLSGAPRPVILSGTTARLSLPRLGGVVQLAFPAPDPGDATRIWSYALGEAGLDASDIGACCTAVADKFPVSLETARAVAADHMAERSAMRRTDNAEELRTGLFATARRRIRRGLGDLAQLVDTAHDWNDLVLPDDAMAQLHELCDRVKHRRRVLDDWGFGPKLSYGKGASALFGGAAGTGKTMAAGIVARDLQLDLLRIDLSLVVSKYIGETAKHLSRIFEEEHAILFFDEADALFGKRSEVRDSHDRYANLEISYLLQRMEEYDGVAILATNLRQNMDEAFTRRLAFVIQFPMPDDSHRRRIWERIWPQETPLANDVDLATLATQLKLSGGNIKNIALAAAYLAVQDGGAVTHDHLIRATRREYQKMGKIMQDDEVAALRSRRGNER